MEEPKQGASKSGAMCRTWLRDGQKVVEEKNGASAVVPLPHGYGPWTGLPGELAKGLSNDAPGCPGSPFKAITSAKP